MNLLMWPERLLFRSESERKENDVDELDRTQELVERFNERARKEISDRAVARRRDGLSHALVVRRCADCRVLIPAERLEVVPYALCCVKCQALREAYGVDQYR
ncbi:TraR/DksA family transcriptional regulator [Salmonella enterica subsp. enterica]|nr:TraR/DksA family transcriptional regulator [Salmonella enterica subsp. enterica serovar Litchfield]EED3047366.1 TraR/DksA family transcriptional regulator [Salmonella enterica subsp. enterica serovar Virchow]